MKVGWIIMDKFITKRKAISQDVLEEMNWKDEIQYDPGKIKLIEKYHPNLKEIVYKMKAFGQVVEYFMTLREHMY
jgi:L-ascorbate metabolism protein UlaG (beta-lactamase superfamily)